VTLISSVRSRGCAHENDDKDENDQNEQATAYPPEDHSGGGHSLSRKPSSAGSNVFARNVSQDDGRDAGKNTYSGQRQNTEDQAQDGARIILCLRNYHLGISHGWRHLFCREISRRRKIRDLL